MTTPNKPADAPAPDREPEKRPEPAPPAEDQSAAQRREGVVSDPDAGEQPAKRE